MADELHSTVLARRSPRFEAHAWATLVQYRLVVVRHGGDGDDDGGDQLRCLPPELRFYGRNSWTTRADEARPAKQLRPRVYAGDGGD